MTSRELLRRKFLSEWYSSLSDEDRRTLSLLSGSSPVPERRDRVWWSDLSANVAGNAVWDGMVWLAKRLMRK